MRKLLTALALVILTPIAVNAQNVTTYEVDGTYDDAVFGLENAIIDRGYLVDLISHVGTMLDRTAADVGATRQIYKDGGAIIYMFCSATLSRKMMDIDPQNIAFCPYSIFINEPNDGSGKVFVGYRNLPEGEMQEVQALLDEMAQEVAEN